MMLEKIRNEIKKYVGLNMHFRYNGARNQVEEFDGMIIDVYAVVFLIKVSDESKLIRSFTYSDVLTDSLEIIENE